MKSPSGIPEFLDFTQKTARQIAWRRGKDRSVSVAKAMQSKIDSNEGKAINPICESIHSNLVLL